MMRRLSRSEESFELFSKCNKINVIGLRAYDKFFRNVGQIIRSLIPRFVPFCSLAGLLIYFLFVTSFFSEKSRYLHPQAAVWALVSCL